MARHHNKAILAAISEQQLDPTKEYVAGKNGLILSANERKKIDRFFETETSKEDVNSSIVDTSVENSDTTKTIVVDEKIQETIETKKLVKDTKFKKKKEKTT